MKNPVRVKQIEANELLAFIQSGTSGHANQADVYATGQYLLDLLQGIAASISGALDVTQFVNRFSVNLPTGVSSARLSYPMVYPIGIVPKIVLNIGSNEGAPSLAYYVSGKDPTGFNLVLSDSTYSYNYYANVFTDSRGEIGEGQRFTTSLTSGTSSQYITYPTAYTLAAPKVVIGLSNSIGNPILWHHLSGINKTGFYLVLSDAVPSTGYTADVFANL